MKKSLKMKKGELIQVIAGKHKGKTGTIKALNRSTQTVVIEGLNLKTKHIKADSVNKTPGYLLTTEFPIHCSNVSKLQEEEK